MVSLPSFGQAPICLGGYWNGNACVFPSNPGNNDPWAGSGSSANTPHPWNQQCSGIGCDSADDDGGGSCGGGNTGGNNGAVCVSEQELLDNIEVCVVATLGATGAGVLAITGTACSTCLLAPNIVSCGSCAALTVFTGLAVRVAASQCKPPEMEVCP